MGSVWNAGNCHMYVLKKDLDSAGFSPYVLDKSEGDAPVSSVTLRVEFVSGEKRDVLLKDYLSIPQPRTQQFAIMKDMMKEQHGIDPASVAKIDPFCGQFSKFK